MIIKLQSIFDRNLASDISWELILGNPNFVPEITFVQKLCDWDGLQSTQKFVLDDEIRSPDSLSE